MTDFIIGGHIDPQHPSGTQLVAISGETLHDALQIIRGRWPYFLPLFAFRTEDWNRHVYLNLDHDDAKVVRP